MKDEALEGIKQWLPPTRKVGGRLTYGERVMGPDFLRPTENAIAFYEHMNDCLQWARTHNYIGELKRIANLVLRYGK